MNARQISVARSRSVRKSNELVQRARYKLDVLGQRILLYLISKIEPQDKEFKKEEFIISDFCEICGIENAGNNYKHLKEALTGLLTDSAKIWIPIDNSRITPLTWIDPPVIDTKTGRVMVKLNEMLRPYLLDLKKNYTQYELIYTLRFRSKYSIRLYEIVKSYQYHDDKPFTKYFDIDDIRALLDADLYPRYGDFKSRVLSIAIDEINQFTDKNLVLEEFRISRRKVNGIEITISAKTGDDLEAVRVLNVVRPRKKRSDDTVPGQIAIPDF